MKLEINSRKKTGKNTNTWRLNNMLLNNQWVNEEIKEKQNKTKQNKKTLRQKWKHNVLKSMGHWKTFLRWKFVVIQAYLKKQVKSQIDNLNLLVRN